MGQYHHHVARNAVDGKWWVYRTKDGVQGSAAVRGWDDMGKAAWHAKNLDKVYRLNDEELGDE